MYSKTVKLQILAISFFATLFFIGCSENNTNPSKTETLKFPLAIGNKINFYIADIDDQGNQEGSFWDVDSLVCDKQEIIDGKNAFFYYQNYAEEGKKYVEIFSLDNNVLYLHRTFIETIVNEYYDNLGYRLPFVPKTKWLRFVDKEKDSWVIFDEDVINFGIDDDYLLTTGKLRMTATLIDTNVQCQVNNKTYKCTAYKYNVMYNGNVFYGSGSGIFGVLRADLNIIQYFNDEIGKVKTLYLPAAIEFGDNLAFKFGGYGTFVYKQIIN